MGSAEMGHQHHALCAVFEAEVDGWERGIDALSVGDLQGARGCLLERHVEVNAHEHALALDQVRDAIKGKFASEHS